MNLGEQYLAAVDKCYVQCLNDPEHEPYRSKYEAKKLFEDMHDIEPNDPSDILRQQIDRLRLVNDVQGWKFISIDMDQSVDDTTGEKQQKFYFI
jgi:hypothetical protein